VQVPEWITDSVVNGAKGIVAAMVIGGATLASRWLVKQFKKMDEQSAKLDALGSNQRKIDDKLDAQAGDLKKIRYEITENSGGSIKDAVNRIEKRQQVAEGVLRARIESADDIAVYCDPSGEITSVTAGYTELTGLDAISSQREKWKLCIHPDDIASVLLAWHESLRTGNTFVADIRYTHVAKGGTTPCKVITSPVIVNNTIVSWASRIKPLAPTLYKPDDEMKAAMDHIDPASRKRPDPPYTSPH
jgi:PAS domain-containing protein